MPLHHAHFAPPIPTLFREPDVKKANSHIRFGPLAMKCRDPDVKKAKKHLRIGPLAMKCRDLDAKKAKKHIRFGPLAMKCRDPEVKKAKKHMRIRPLAMKCPEPEGKNAKQQGPFGESTLPQGPPARRRFEAALKSGRDGMRAFSRTFPCHFPQWALGFFHYEYHLGIRSGEGKHRRGKKKGRSFERPSACEAQSGSHRSCYLRRALA
jgi:Zn finger protein HypA/HybF involved in hydrogenase expression